LFITRISNPTQNWTWKTTATEEQEQEEKHTTKDEKYAHLLSCPGWLTRGRGEKRREEKRLCSSSPCFCVAQVPEESWKAADEKERQREESGRQESGIKAKVEKRRRRKSGEEAK
jgi:hypothetical protein